MEAHLHLDSTEPLESRQKHAVLVSASLVSRRGDRLVADLKAALERAFTPGELSELILQSLLFDGYPCALEGFLALKEILNAPLPADSLFEAYSPESCELWSHRGRDLCRLIYGDNFDRLLQNVASLSPTLKEWMLMEGYGRVLARPTLSILLRELGIIAILTVKGLPRQLHSHLRGASRVGASPQELRTAVHLCAPYTTPENVESALNIWRNLNQSSA